MASDKLIPYGEGIKGDFEPFPYKLMEVFVLKKIVNEEGLPFIHVQNAKKREYRKTLFKDDTFYTNSEEFKRFLKYYNPKKTDYRVVIHYSFNVVKASSIFKKYIDF
jgi:hypothetical protein